MNAMPNFTCMYVIMNFNPINELNRINNTKYQRVILITGAILEISQRVGVIPSTLHFDTLF